MLALGMGVILLGAGAAVDMSQLTSVKLRTANLADGMALAAAKAARNGNTRAKRIELGREAAEAVFEANLASLGSGDALVPVIDVNDSTKDVTITVKADVDNYIMGMFGQENTTASSESVVNYRVDSIPPISMAFAFDSSISMSFDAYGDPSRTRLEVLQAATVLLFEAMESEASNPALLKASFSTTISSFAHELVDQQDWSTGAQSIDNIIDYVDQMSPSPGGGTVSTPSLQYALEQMTTNRPLQDRDWHGFVLFMTDGNNQSGDFADGEINEESLEVCEDLKNDGSITVITVGLGLSGEAQDFLEECATPGNYYESDNAEEIEADFAQIGREIGEVVLRLKY